MRGEPAEHHHLVIENLVLDDFERPAPLEGPVEALNDDSTLDLILDFALRPFPLLNQLGRERGFQGGSYGSIHDHLPV